MVVFSKAVVQHQLSQTLHKTPFEAVYGYVPTIHMPYASELVTMAAVERDLLEREQLINELKLQLQRVQHCMKQIADKHRIERSFEVGDWVYLKLYLYKQLFVVQRGMQKLATKYFGPFQIIAKIGPVAYKLDLPSEAKIYNVFHISKLKKQAGTALVSPHLPACATTVVQKLNPVAILERRMKKKGNHMTTKILVQWEGYSPAKATWEDYHELQK